MTETFTLTHLKGARLHVLIALAHARETGQGAVGWQWLSHVTGYGKSAVLTALQALCDSEDSAVKRHGRYHGWQLCGGFNKFPFALLLLGKELDPALNKEMAQKETPSSPLTEPLVYGSAFSHDDILKMHKQPASKPFDSTKIENQPSLTLLTDVRVEKQPSPNLPTWLKTEKEPSLVVQTTSIHSPRLENQTCQLSNQSSRGKNQPSPPYDLDLMNDILMMSEDDALLLMRMRAIDFGQANGRLAKLNKQQLAAWLLWWEYLPRSQKQGYRRPAAWIHACLKNDSWPEDLPALWQQQKVESNKLQPEQALNSPPETPPPISQEQDKLWQAVLAELALQMPKATFHKWLQPTKLLERSAGKVTIGVVNTYAQAWLSQRLKEVVLRVLTVFLGDVNDVEFAVMG